MFDLNDNKQFGGVQIFNDGVAGLVKNVEVSVEKRGLDEPDTYPNYKLVITDESGASINAGFYYFTPNPNKDEESNRKSEISQVGRVLHIARAVMGKDYNFPTFQTSKEVYDELFKLIHANTNGKKFNVFVTYGNEYRPSAYLSLRYFDFIQPANSEVLLKAKNGDIMERPTPDADASLDGSMAAQNQLLDEL